MIYLHAILDLQFTRYNSLISRCIDSVPCLSERNKQFSEQCNQKQCYAVCRSLIFQLSAISEKTVMLHPLNFTVIVHFPLGSFVRTIDVFTCTDSVLNTCSNIIDGHGLSSQIPSLPCLQTNWVVPLNLCFLNIPLGW